MQAERRLLRASFCRGGLGPVPMTHSPGCHIPLAGRSRILELACSVDGKSLTSSLSTPQPRDPGSKPQTQPHFPVLGLSAGAALAEGSRPVAGT